MKIIMNQMIETVLSWYNESSANSKNEFKTCEEDDLVRYHSSLGRDIRNHFKLWVNYVPEMYEDGMCGHPDEISMEVITKVWRKVNE